MAIRVNKWGQKTIRKKCLRCDTEFNPYRKSNMFCSRFCAVRNRKGITRYNKIEFICQQCHKIYLKQSKSVGKTKFCSRVCMMSFRVENKLVVGKNNANWQGGKSFEPYSIEFNKPLKNSIRKRDNYICHLCGIQEIELNEKLAVHHIDYDKQNCSPNNLISLCRSCNTRANYYSRKLWQMIFSEINTWIRDGFIKVRDIGYVKK